jgi:peptidoglycan/LPS O-acetylase OafA/YrhL
MSAAAPAPAVDLPAKKQEKGFFSLDLLDNRYPALHGFRVLAILSVVQYHVTWILAGEQGVVFDRGFTDGSLLVFFGMDLFFILSGFLIGMILIRSLATSGTQNIRRFYVRRVLRTFPSYYLVLTALALMFPLTAEQKKHLVYEYTYLTNFMPLERGEVIMFWGWSLALEEQFYLTVPALFFLLHRLKSDRARLSVLGFLWATALALRLYIFYRFAPWNDFILYGAIYFRTPTRFDTLIAGIMLAFVHDRWGDRIARWLEEPFHRAALLLPSFACLWLLIRPTMFGDENLQLVRMFTWGTITSLMYFGILPLLLYGKGTIQKWLSAPIFRRIATLGYGVYLVHIPFIDHVVAPLAKKAQDRHISMLIVWPAALLLDLVLSFAVAYALHIFVEKPSLHLRERIGA